MTCLKLLLKFQRARIALDTAMQVTYGGLIGSVTNVFKFNRTGNLLFTREGFLANAQRTELNAAYTTDEPLLMNTKVVHRPKYCFIYTSIGINSAFVVYTRIQLLVFLLCASF